MARDRRRELIKGIPLLRNLNPTEYKRVQRSPDPLEELIRLNVINVDRVVEVNKKLRRFGLL